MLNIGQQTITDQFKALDFVMGNRDRFPFKDIVDSKFSLEQLDEAFERAATRSVLRAAIVP